jgi:hypothetical protein
MKKATNIIILSLSLSLFLFLFAACKHKATTNSFNRDNRELLEYYKLCLGANKSLIAVNVLKNKDYNDRDNYFAEIVGNRIIAAKVVILNKYCVIDTAYQLALYDSVPLAFKPLKQRYLSIVETPKKLVIQQEYLGINELSDAKDMNIMLFQTAMIVNNKVVLTAVYFQIPVCADTDLFNVLSPELCDASKISFLNRLQNRSYIPNDKLRQFIDAHLFVK